MYDTIFGPGNHVFGALVLILCLALSSYRVARSSSFNVRDVFVASLLLLMIGYQYYWLVEVSTYIPSSKFYMYDVSMHDLL